MFHTTKHKDRAKLKEIQTKLQRTKENHGKPNEELGHPQKCEIQNYGTHIKYDGKLREHNGKPINIIETC